MVPTSQEQIFIFLSPVLLGAKVSSNAFSCGKQGWIEGLTHAEVWGYSIWDSWIRWEECGVKFLTKAGTWAPIIATKPEPWWTELTNAFTEKCLSIPVFCILEFLLSLHFGLVAPCCLFGSSIVFRILSYLSSFFCLFVFSGRISPSKTAFCYHKGKSLSGGPFVSLLPLCFCHHSLCTWLPSSLARTPAVAFCILSLNCLFPSLIHTLYRSLHLCLSANQIVSFVLKTLQLLSRVQSVWPPVARLWPLNTCYMAGATEELNF